MRSKRFIDFTIPNNQLTISDLRQIVAQTNDVVATSSVEFRVEEGQRDAQYLHVIITEDNDLGQ